MNVLWTVKVWSQNPQFSTKQRVLVNTGAPQIQMRRKKLSTLEKDKKLVFLGASARNVLTCSFVHPICIIRSLGIWHGSNNYLFSGWQNGSNPYCE